MKIIILLLTLISFSYTTHAKDIIEVDIHGMTCAFCVDALQRSLGKLPDVAKVDVSLKHKMVRIETKVGDTDIDRIRKAILDTGFTPVAVRNTAGENK